MLGRIQLNLRESKHIREGYGFFFVNCLALLVLACMIWGFAWIQYSHTSQLIPEKNIPKQQFVWNNSIRNAIDT